MEIETDSAGGQWILVDPTLLDGTIEALAGVFDGIQAAMAEPVTGIRLRLPPGEGSGHWDVVRLSPALFVMAGTVEYHKAKRILVADSRMVKVRILLSGQMTHLETGTKLSGTGAFVEAYPSDISSDYELEGGEQVRLLILNCGVDFFTRELGLPIDALPQPLAHVLCHDSSQTQGSIVPLGPDILRAANDMLRGANEYAAALRPAWLRAKACEIACSMIADLGRREKGTGHVPVKATVRDMNRVNEARDILLDRYQRPPKIPQLARMVGINQTKLKALFKATFGLTVHEFVQKCRMERALDLLTTTDLGIAEIAYALGYNYPASFTHAFRQFYGHAPRSTRNSLDQRE
jgi:AraC-like DNA-binding protein